MATPKQKPQVIFLILGILLLIISFLLVRGANPSETVKFWSTAIQNISFIILTVVIVDVLWQVLGGEPISESLRVLGATLAEMRSAVLLLQDSKETGLHRMFAVSGAWGSHREWMQRLKDSKSSVDLVGYSLHVWTRGENFEEVVKALVKAGVKVRILIMDDTNPNLGALVNAAQIASVSHSAVVEEIKVAKRTFKGIADSFTGTTPSGSYEFRVLKTGLVVSQICRTDSQLTAVQYLYSVVASRSPLVDVRGTDSALFKVYMNEFENLWLLGVAA
jgi:hypothetical protein